MAVSSLKSLKVKMPGTGGVPVAKSAAGLTPGQKADGMSLVAAPPARRQQIFTTVDRGRTHIGVDEGYTGSVNSYNNCFTRLFAWVFGWSTKVTINGKTRHLDKQDYVRWLGENSAYTDVSTKNLTSYLNLNDLQIVKPIDRGYMRDHISAAKSHKLFNKMINALVNNQDTEKARKYIGKGSFLEGQFWVRNGYGITHNKVTDGLPADKALDVEASLYTPLLYAADRNNQTFVTWLRQFNANTGATGQRVDFSRRIMEVDPVTSIVKSEDFVSNDGRLLTRVTIKTITTMQFEDQLTPKWHLSFDSNTNSLVNAKSKDPIIIERYSKKNERLTTRYL